LNTVFEELTKTEELLKLVAEETGKKPELDDSLESLGIDSLDFVSLMQAVENKFGMVIPPEQYTNIDTVRDIRVRI